ncbi:hypothetical protein [Mucilaginibacter ginsenosidivorax]|uniref:Uncharacterized protein n=1 Tax=Mucilaginibacter ginsenosidivorax TaxID=862126 RepID=A0A5B8VZZ8_9SPHI|nr:hypothetical protein [Mucilaginibacter ginsenosidivorax]QEC77237.1 hypothetical protein FSB76_15255 [Mucilaginibacter ginsenosidivorax]
MKKFDIKYAVKGKQFDLNIRAKSDSVIKGVYYSLYMHGVWLANIYKTGMEQYKALSYTSAFHQHELEAIGRQIDLVN